MRATGAKGGQGPGLKVEMEKESDADSESLWVPVGALCAACVGQWSENVKSFVKLSNKFVRLIFTRIKYNH